MTDTNTNTSSKTENENEMTIEKLNEFLKTANENLQCGPECERQKQASIL